MCLRLNGWLLVFLLTALVAGCSRESTPPADTAKAAVPAAEPADSSPEFSNLLPVIGGRAGYAGAESCRECHQDQHASWHRSYHRTMTQLAAPAATAAQFNGVVLTNNGTRFRLSQQSNELWVRMEKLVADAGNQLADDGLDVRLSLVTGSHHMQVFWVPNGAGNCQVGFPFTWLIPEARWVPRGSTFLRPPDTLHQSETWNIVCARCHSTAPEPHLDKVNRRFDTRVAEMGISCEACHGPAERHVAFEQTARRENHDTKGMTNHAIIHPEKLDPRRASQICGFCHSMKWYDNAEGWSQDGFRYRPGDDLEATTPIIRPRQLEQQPWLKKVLAANTNLLNEFFWRDGMVRVSGREYNGLLESPCYRGGKFSCLSCHSLHSSEPDDQLAKNRTDNRACIQCHERFREPAQVTAHTHHAGGSSGSECYNCHMPHTTYGVLSAIRSHEISSPKVEDELTTGRPNACNLCHLDRPLQWTAQQLEKWYRQPLPPLDPEQTDVADSVRLALSGNAGQRILMAWHLGWQPAHDASGPTWKTPVLAQLLEDPYAAVRCVAERSLRQLGVGIPSGYDYSTHPGSIPVRNLIWQQWWQTNSVPAGSPKLPVGLLPAGDVAEMARQFAHRSENQDRQPLRLRE